MPALKPKMPAMGKLKLSSLPPKEEDQKKPNLGFSLDKISAAQAIR
jgi:hypothetical protein